MHLGHDFGTLPPCYRWSPIVKAKILLKWYFGGAHSVTGLEAYVAVHDNHFFLHSMSSSKPIDCCPVNFAPTTIWIQRFRGGIYQCHTFNSSPSQISMLLGRMGRSPGCSSYLQVPALNSSGNLLHRSLPICGPSCLPLRFSQHVGYEMTSIISGKVKTSVVLDFGGDLLFSGPPPNRGHLEEARR